MTDFTWQSVDAQPQVTTRDPQLSVYTDGSGRINAVADKRWFKDAEGFARHFDPDRHAIGFEPVDDLDAADGPIYQISRQHETGGTIGLEKALSVLGIDTDAIDETWHVPLENHDGIIVADLTELVAANNAAGTVQRVAAEAADETDATGASTGTTPTATDEARAEILDVLHTHDGQVQQQTIVDATGWSKSTVSARLAAMANDGSIQKTQVGRENIISLPGQDSTAQAGERDDAGDSTDETYECAVDGCDSRFGSERGRNVHVARVHDDAEAEVPADDADTPSLETVRDCAGSVDSVQELAELLEVSDGEARHLARQADVYGAPDLVDRPARPGVSRQ